MKKLLQEFVPHDLALIEGEDAQQAAKDGGFLAMVSGVAMNAGVVTANKTLYPLKIVQREVKRIQSAIKAGQVIALADHPNYWTTNEVRETAIRWTRVWMEGTDVHVEGGIVDTAAGRDVLGARKGGVKFGLSSRGYGGCDPVKMTKEHPDYERNKKWLDKIVYEVQEDFELVTPADVVLRPSNLNAWMESEITESLERLRVAAESIQSSADQGDYPMIKTLKDLKEAVSADILEAILKEARSGFIAESDKKAAIDKAIKEALADKKAAAKTLGLDESVADYVLANVEALSTLASEKKPVAELVASSVTETITATAAPIADAATEKRLAELEKRLSEKDASEQVLREQLNASDAQVCRLRNEKHLAAMVEKATLGSPWAKRLTASALGNLQLPADFDPANADQWKAEQEKVQTFVDTAASEYRLIATESGLAPAGRGRVAATESADDIDAKRKAFAEKYPSLAFSEKQSPHVMLAADQRGVLSEWKAVYGKDAIESCPLK